MILIPTLRRTALLGLSRGYLDSGRDSVGHITGNSSCPSFAVSATGPVSSTLLALTRPYDENFPVLLEVTPSALTSTCTQSLGRLTLWSGAIAADLVARIHVRSERDLREMRARAYDGLPGAGLPLTVSPDLFGSGPDDADRLVIESASAAVHLPPCADARDLDRVAALIIAHTEMVAGLGTINESSTRLVDRDWRKSPAIAPVVIASGACALLAGPGSSLAEIAAIVAALMATSASSGLADVLAALSLQAPLPAAAGDWSEFLEVAARFADDDPYIDDIAGGLFTPHRGALLLWSCEPEPALACATAWPGCGADATTRVLAAGYSSLVLGLDATLRRVRDRSQYGPVVAGLVTRMNRRTASGAIT